MNRPRIDLGLESSSLTLDVKIARRAGQQLARARTMSAVSLASIEARLLLSRNQIRSLETADPDTFYNARFHAVALRKYADLLGVEVDGLDNVLVDPAVEASNADSQTGGPLRAGTGAWTRVPPRFGPRTAIAAGAVVTILALVLIVGWRLARADDVDDQAPHELTTSLSVTAR